MDRRTDILEAACRAVEQMGLSSLRVADVAHEAGVSSALVYYYFDTRAQLVAELFDYSNLRSGIETERRLRTRSPARVVLERTLLLELDDTPAVRRNWIIWTELLSSALFDADASRLMAKATTEWVDEIADLIGRGLADGSIARSVVPGDAAQRLVSVLDGVGTQWMLGHLSRRAAGRLLRGAIANELGGAA